MKMGVIVRKIEWEEKDSRDGGIQNSTAKYETVQHNTKQYSAIQ